MEKYEKKKERKRKLNSRQKLRVSAHSAARYATIIPSLANPLFSLQPLEGSFAIRAPSTWRCGIMVYGRSPGPTRTSGLWSRAYILVGSRIIRLQSFALNHEANDASWRWSRRGEITEWNWFKQTPPGVCGEFCDRTFRLMTDDCPS